MYVSLAELPERYRRQVKERYCFNGKKENKYKNTRTSVGGISFDSKKEAARFNELRLMYSAGFIKDLRLQHAFTLQEPYTTPEGKRIRGITYIADFTYWRDGEFIVEDVKSKATAKDPKYRMKVKMMMDKFEIDVREV